MIPAKSLVLGLCLPTSVGLFLACGGDESSTGPSNTAIEVTTMTTGEDPDPDGYVVTITGGQEQRIGVNATHTFPNVAPGSYSVTVSDVAANCTLAGDNPRTVTVSAGSTEPVSLQITCVHLPGTLEITVSTTGVELDPDGYAVTINGGPPQALAINGSLTVEDLVAGTYSVELTDVAPSCTVGGANPAQASVTPGSVTTTAFQVGCSRKAIVFVSNRSGRNQLYLMSLEGSGQAQLTSSLGNDVDPVWSPNGTKIAFSSTRDGNSEIYVINADGSGATRLTSNAGDDTEPTWSPDGTNIAFTSNRDGNSEIYLMGADGSGVTRLTSNAAADNAPAWSPTNNKIAFVSARDGNSEIYGMNTDGTGVVRLTSNSALDAAPAWSPDGLSIAFHSDRNGTFEIFIMNSQGGDLLQRTFPGDRESQPRWSPVGNQLTFVTSLGANDEVCTGSASSGGATNLSQDGADDFRPAWR